MIPGGQQNHGCDRLFESQLGEGVGAGLCWQDAGDDGDPAGPGVMTGGWGGGQQNHDGDRFVGSQTRAASRGKAWRVRSQLQWWPDRVNRADDG